MLRVTEWGTTIPQTARCARPPPKKTIYIFYNEYWSLINHQSKSLLTSLPLSTPTFQDPAMETETIPMQFGH